MVTASDFFNLLGELLIRFEARQDLGNPVYLNATLASSCENRTKSEKIWFRKFHSCQGEPEIFESKPAVGRRAPCRADQAFALRRWHGTELTELTEPTWTVVFQLVLQLVLQHGSMIDSMTSSVPKEIEQ